MNLDIEEDSQCDLNEYLRLLGVYRTPLPEDTVLADAFAALGYDHGAGNLPVKQLQHILQTLDPDMANDTVHAIIKTVDRDGTQPF